MADGKKSFVLYTDLKHTFDLLDDASAGKLIKHLLDYVNDLSPETDDILVRVAFEPIKRQLKRDLKEWEEERNNRIEAGRLGGINSGISRRKKQDEANRSTPSKNEANEAQLQKTKQTQANEAVTVNVTVSVNVTEIGADPSTQTFYDMLVPEIIEVWMEENSSYHFNQDLDYHAALRIAYQIAGIKKWKKADVVEDKKDECVESWKKIAKFIMGHSWFSKMTLDSIAGDKIWQKIVVEMKGASNGNGKSGDYDYMVQAREDYLKSKK